MKHQAFKTAAVIFLTLFSASVAAQYKVVESSAKKKPEWLTATMPGYLTFSAESTTLQMAQQKCMDNIRNEIINSIAVNISAQSTTTTQQERRNNNFYMSERFQNEFVAKAANLPFLTGISIANAEAFYWEKLYDREKKDYHYIYYIKYPFSRMERNRLIAEFKAYDSEKYNALRAIRQKSENIVCIDDIRAMLLELEPIKDYFFDSTRKAEAQALQEQLRNLTKNIQISPVSNKPGEYRYALVLDNRRVTMGKLPVTRSEYATNIGITSNPSDTTYTVSYKYDGCLPEDENSIDLLFNFRGTVQKHRFYFNLPETTR